MASDRERRYWDSFCFLAVLNNEEPYASTCMQILEEAKKNNVDLVISPMTMAETVRPEGHRPRFQSNIRSESPISSKTTTCGSESLTD